MDTNRIAHFRRLRRLTQQQLADAVGVDRKTVNRWESGRADALGANLVRLAEVLGQPLDGLFTPEAEERMQMPTQNEILCMLGRAEGELAKGINLRNMGQEDAETDESTCMAAGVTLALKWVLGHITDPMTQDDGFPIRNVDTGPAALAEAARVQAVL
jgi:transcriptional regulator with XRE-family HTH domain